MEHLISTIYDFNSVVLSYSNHIFIPYIFPLNVFGFFTAGITRIPEFIIGVKCAFLMYFATIPVGLLFSKTDDKETLKESSGVNHDPTMVIITGPVIEELQYRFILQKGFIHLFSSFLNIDYAMMLSVTLSSFFFGLSHAGLRHKNIQAHCVNAQLNGYVLGYLMEKYGIWSSIAAHSTYNSMVLLTGLMYSKFLT
jgi:membrane protease YdiL (CAAX protease family)